MTPHIPSTGASRTPRLAKARNLLRRAAPLGPWISLAVALVVLNFALTFHNVWPTFWITTRHELSIEIAMLLLALAVYSEAVRPPSRRSMSLLACALVVLCIGRYAEVTAPALYGRAVNLYWDAPHLLNVAAMLNQAASPLISALVGLTLVAVMVSVFFLLQWCLNRLRHSLQSARARRTLATMSAGAVAIYAIGHTSSPWRTLGWFSIPVSATYWRQAEFALDAHRQARDPNVALCSRSESDLDVSRVAGSDVFVVFLESYGATAYDRPPISHALAQSREKLASAVASTGRGVVSAYVRSPTFGGASWLAHMSLLTGRSVVDNGTYNLLLTQNCDVLTREFSAQGYRVVGLMPGLKGEWPEGAFYSFDAIYGERALEYVGPEFGWWRIPDQYALAKLDRAELASASRAPLFVFFPTISSHMPFRPTPPYQPAWSRLMTHKPYDSAAVTRSLAVEPDWTNLTDDYSDTIAYALEYLGGYLLERPDLDLLLLVLGDHQPPASVSGEETRWDVPVHVITGRRDILDALLDAGFVSGLTPADEAIGPMHQLAGLVFRPSPPASAQSLRRVGSSGAEQRGIDVAGSGTLGQVGDEPSDSLGVEPLAGR